MAAPSDASYPVEAFVASYQNETAGEGHAGGPLLTPMETAVLVARLSRAGSAGTICDLSSTSCRSRWCSPGHARC